MEAAVKYEAVYLHDFDEWIGCHTRHSIPSEAYRSNPPWI